MTIFQGSWLLSVRKESSDQVIVEKVLRSLTSKFDYVVPCIEVAYNLSELCKLFKNSIDRKIRVAFGVVDVALQGVVEEETWIVAESRSATCAKSSAMSPQTAGIIKTLK